MIKSYANSATRQFVEKGKSAFSGLDERKALRRLLALANAVTLADLGGLASFGLHKLSADRKGQWAIAVNGPWRICFRFDGGDAYDVEIVDYH